MPILALLRRGSGCRLGWRKAEVVVSLLAPLAPCCEGGERRWVDGFGKISVFRIADISHPSARTCPKGAMGND
eukprot:scaffold4987_cov192-Alexandrium_tamarense.AAC.4